MRKEDDAVIGEVYCEVGVGVMRRQVARMLSLDVDGLGFHEGAERNPVARGLQQRHPGLRPVCLHSPYEAAWAVHRPLRPRSAGRKGQGPHGRGVGAEGEGREQDRTRLPRFLLPGGVGRVSEVDRLRHLARATGEGRLEEDLLRLLPAGEVPLPRLREPPGIGPFSAELGLLRGAGEPDRLPTRGPRLKRRHGGLWVG